MKTGQTRSGASLGLRATAGVDCDIIRFGVGVKRETRKFDQLRYDI
jgi:hypothetical protein